MAEANALGILTLYILIHTWIKSLAIPSMEFGPELFLKFWYFFTC